MLIHVFKKTWSLCKCLYYVCMVLCMHHISSEIRNITLMKIIMKELMNKRINYKFSMKTRIFFSMHWLKTTSNNKKKTNLELKGDIYVYCFTFKLTRHFTTNFKKNLKSRKKYGYHISLVILFSFTKMYTQTDEQKKKHR